MPKQGVVSIGLNVDYQKALQQMMNDFKSKLSTISNEAKKLDFSKDLTKQIGAVDEKIERISNDFKAMFDEINGQKLDSSKFEQYQTKITKDFDKVEKSISNVVSQISALDEKVGMLSGADFASSMKAQFDELRESVLSTYQGLEKVFDLTKSSSGFKGGIDSSALKDYKKTLAEINKYRKEMQGLNFGDMSSDDIYDNFDKHEESMSSYMETYKKLKSELENTPKSSAQYDILENKLVQVQIAALRASETIQELSAEAENRGMNIGIHPKTQSMIKEMKLFEGEIEDFSVKAKRFVDTNKEAQDSIKQTQTTFNTFQIKNGAIHVPVEVATKSGTLQKQLQETIDKLQEYAQKNSIIAKVRLTLDGGSASGYKKNSDITKQLEEGQNEPAVDISKAIKKTYVQAVREAEKTAKDSIKAIQTIFDSSPVKITPNKEAFTAELSAMVSSSLGKIAEGTTGLNVNQELEKLVTNLREVSTSLSGNENFKFGLDEASIERITAAIKNMADMIQRAFGVASNDDIAAQWTTIESKFKGVAGEEGKLLKGNKEHKLERQAIKTGTALDNEGNVAQTAAEKFAELAEKKKAATEANLDLGIAAEMTTKALKEEMAALKEAEQRKKTNKKAVDEGTYESNASAWQKSIKQSLLDGGNYLEVYDGKLSRLESGTVRYTAFVKDSAEDSAESWKKLTATISSTGEIQSTKLQDITEKQFLKMEKEKKDSVRMLEKMAGEGEEPIKLDRSELELYSDEITRVLKDLEELSGTTYKVNITSGGKLAITRKEIADSGAEAEQFTVIIDRIDSIFEETADGIVVSSSKIEAALNGAFDSAKISTSAKDLVSKAQDAFNKFELKHKGNSNWSNVAKDMAKLEQSIASIDSQDRLNKFKQDLSDIAVKLNNIGKDNKLGKILNDNKTFSDINEVRANIDSLFASMGKVNEKSIRITGTDKLTAEVKLANGEIRKMEVSLDSNNFARFVDKGIVEFGRLRSAAEGVFKGIQSMVRIYLSPQDFIRYFRQGFDAVREIDTAMTELRKVSDASPGDITAYFDDAVESAKELGSSVNEMIGATADWQRMGYNLQDSREIGEVAVLYKNVGDGIDVDTANESLVSTMQGFQLQAKDAMSVIDAFNEVSNNYAISSGGIGEALKRSAAAFNAANTDLNQAIALITAGNEIVQSPEKVGTMWQTVSARIRGTKAELEALGESTDDVLSTSKLQSLVKGYTDVDIMLDKDTYKDIYTIVSEIGEKWKGLKDVERAALLEGLAGKKQSNTLAAVLNNYERLEKIYQTAEDSMGSAQKEQDRYTQSLQYSLDQLTAHGEEFWSTFINKDDVKTFINNVNILISGATKLVDTFGSIPTVTGILGGFAAIKNVGINMLVAYLSNRCCFELPTI